jgi:energy-coupling factor transporter transmembrane protein EcfT
LFLLGLFLALVAFPAALVASVALGYLLAIAALAVGIYMAVKRGGRILPLVLGVVLAVFSFMILTGSSGGTFNRVRLFQSHRGERKRGWNCDCNNHHGNNDHV